MAKIYLIRHCESEGNACRRTQAQVDALVTNKGYEQSEMLRRRFRDVPVDAVYTSDSYRSRVTGEPIAQDHNAPVRVRICLREVTTGVWEDMAWGNIAKEYPKENRVWSTTPWNSITPGATTFQQAADRMVYGLRRIAREVGPEGTAVAVSHSCAIKATLCAIMGKPMDCVGQVLHSDNTAVSLLEVDSEGTITIVYMNDASHLPDRLKRAWNGVAGDEINMSVEPVRTPEQEELFLALADRDAGGGLDKNGCRQSLRALLRDNPGYAALCYLQGRAVGYVRIGRGADLPDEIPLVERMYVVPELEGKGYCEQLLGYVFWLLRYADIYRVAMRKDCGREERRVMDRFRFEDLPEKPEYRVLGLMCPPCPYPILA